MKRKTPSRKPDTNSTKDAPLRYLEPADVQALRDAQAGVFQAQAIFQAFQGFVANKYGLGANDAVDINTGVVTKGDA